MYVRGKSIIIALAVLISGSAYAQEAVNRLQRDYNQNFKPKFMQDPAGNAVEANQRLDAIASAIGGVSNSQARGQLNSWLRTERADVASRIPATPTRAPIAPTPVPSGPSVVPSLTLAQKQDYINQLFDYLVAKNDRQRSATLIRLIDGFNKGDGALTKQLNYLIDLINVNALAAGTAVGMASGYSELQNLQTNGDWTTSRTWAYGWGGRITAAQKTLVLPVTPAPSAPSAPTVATLPALPKAPIAVVQQVANILKDFRDATTANDLKTMRDLHTQALNIFGQYSGLNQAIMDELDDTMTKAHAATPPAPTGVSLATAQQLINNLFDELEYRNDRQRTAALLRIIKGNNAGDQQSIDDLHELVDTMQKVAGSTIQKEKGYEALEDYQTSGDWYISRAWTSVKVKAANKVIDSF